MATGSRIVSGTALEFAGEIVRASLPHIAMDSRPGCIWMQQIRMEVGGVSAEKSDERQITFVISVDLRTRIHANCTVRRTNGTWSSGNVRIELLDETGHHNDNTEYFWFRSHLNADGKIIAEQTE